MFSSIRRIHFVGIGGIGMSGIAEILINQGFEVSGSDMQKSQNTDYLENIGANIFIGHKEENIEGAECIVYSSAVKPEENPETIAGKLRNIPIIRRAEMLSEVARLNYCLAISGTHGKTSTSSMLALILIEAKFDPTVIIGGRLTDFGGTNARLGKGQWTVVEADEYDRSFLQLTPTVAVITNIEAEHLDIYKDEKDIQQTFTTFANKTPFYGFIVACLDDSGVKYILPDLQRKVITYGISRNSDYRAAFIEYNDRNSSFVVYEHGEELGKIEINVPGLHNVKNSLAAVAVARNMGISYDIIRNALAKFHGVYRRFEIKGEVDGVMVVDDYAHHPTEVRSTLAAARRGWNRRIVAVFQPHTYTRTQSHYKEFGQSFDDADVLIVTDVYPARETPIEGVTGKLIADAAISFGNKYVYYMPDVKNVAENIKPLLKEGDMLVTLGAGNVYQVGEKILNL